MAPTFTRTSIEIRRRYDVQGAPVVDGPVGFAPLRLNPTSVEVHLIDGTWSVAVTGFLVNPDGSRFGPHTFYDDVRGKIPDWIRPLCTDTEPGED